MLTHHAMPLSSSAGAMRDASTVSEVYRRAVRSPGGYSAAALPSVQAPHSGQRVGVARRSKPQLNRTRLPDGRATRFADEFGATKRRQHQRR